MRMVSPKVNMYKLAHAMGSWLNVLVNVLLKTICSMWLREEKRLDTLFLTTEEIVTQHHLLYRARGPG